MNCFVLKHSRRFILAIFLLILQLPVFSYGDAAVESYWDLAYQVNYDVYVNAPDGGVNLRNGAGTEYSIMLSGLIPNGTKLHVTYEAKASNGKKWGQVIYQGQQGWIFLGQTSRKKPETSSASGASDEKNPVSAEAVDKENGGKIEENVPSDQSSHPQETVNVPDEQNDKDVDDVSTDTDERNDDADSSLESDDSAGSSAPVYHTPMMLVITGLLIVIIVLLALILLRKGRK